MAEVNFYKILGISKDATDEEIKSAFRVKAKMYHPDTGINDETDYFRLVKDAYDTLSVPEKRKKYDESGYVNPSNIDLNNLALERMRDLLKESIMAQGSLVFNVNIIDVMINKCDQIIKESEKNIEDCLNEKKHIARLSSKFRKKKKTSENIIRMIFNGEIFRINDKINSNLIRIKIHEKLKEIISEYTYDYQTGE